MKKVLSAFMLLGTFIFISESALAATLTIESKMRVDGVTYMSSDAGVIRASNCFGMNDRTFTLTLSANSSQKTNKELKTNFIGRTSKAFRFNNDEFNMDFESAAECQSFQNDIMPDDSATKKTLTIDQENNSVSVNQRKYNLK